MTSLIQSESSNVEANQAITDCNGPAAPSAVKEHLFESEEDPHAIKERLPEVEGGETFSTPFCTLRCGSAYFRFLRDEEQTLCINIVDLLIALKCEVDCVPEGCVERNLFDLKPDVKMTFREGFEVYATPPEVRSIISRCNTLESERVLVTLRETWPEAFGETWFR